MEQNPKLVEVRAGWEVTLNCGIRNEHAEFLIASDVFWFFKVSKNIIYPFGEY